MADKIVTLDILRKYNDLRNEQLKNIFKDFREIMTDQGNDIGVTIKPWILTTQDWIDAEGGRISAKIIEDVPEWAREGTKPTYTPNEIGAQPKIDNDHKLKYSLLSDTPHIPSKLSEFTDNDDTTKYLKGLGFRKFSFSGNVMKFEGDSSSDEITIPHIKGESIEFGGGKTFTLDAYTKTNELDTFMVNNGFSKVSCDDGEISIGDIKIKPLTTITKEDIMGKIDAADIGAQPTITSASPLPYSLLSGTPHIPTLSEGIIDFGNGNTFTHQSLADYTKTDELDGVMVDKGFSKKTNIPTKMSQLENDTNFVTKNFVQTSGYQTASQVESTVTSKGYQTSTQVSEALANYGTKEDMTVADNQMKEVLEKLNELTNTVNSHSTAIEAAVTNISTLDTNIGTLSAAIETVDKKVSTGGNTSTFTATSISGIDKNTGTAKFETVDDVTVTDDRFKKTAVVAP